MVEGYIEDQFSEVPTYFFWGRPEEEGNKISEPSLLAAESQQSLDWIEQ